MRKGLAMFGNSAELDYWGSLCGLGGKRQDLTPSPVQRPRFIFNLVRG
jgi:hypothetical protein